jgi:tetratricopeptide (TPR) repeat protein
MRSFFALLPTALVCVAACGGNAAVRPVAEVARGPSTGPQTTTQIVSGDDDPGGPAAEVFERAKAKMIAGEFARARLLFDRVVEAEAAATTSASPTALGSAAAYNAALCLESLGDLAQARDRFRAGPFAGDDLLDAELRRARIDVELEDFRDLEVASSAILARSDLGRYERAEALSLQAFAILHGRSDRLVAAKVAATARKLVEGKDRPDDVAPPQVTAAVHFAHGEVLRAEAHALVFVDATDPERPVVAADFPTKMETRCQRILDAQDAYVEAINTRDPTWAVRAGLRVASMYVTLHDDVLAIPPPKSATTDDKKALFRGAMRLRYRILLEKGLGTLERTLNLEKAVGAKTTWLAQAREAKAALERQLDAEKAELAKLPYTEAQLQKAFEDLSRRPAGKG